MHWKTWIQRNSTRGGIPQPGMAKRAVHRDPQSAFAVWTQLAGERTDAAAAAVLAEDCRILKRIRLDRLDLDGSPFDDRVRLEAFEPPITGWTGPELRWLREHTGLTQTELARRMGLGEGGQITISRWETGERSISEPHARWLRQLCWNGAGASGPLTPNP